MVNLLIIDDDPKFRAYIRRGLEESGIACETAADAAEARGSLERVSRGHFDLILLDVMMPGEWGWAFLEQLRTGGDETPVIFLTARQAVEERVKGLRLGADDYIIKPFAFSELLARVEAVARRRRPLTVTLGGLVIDFERRTVTRAGRRIEMSPREFDLLQALGEARGQVRSRSELLRTVWEIEFDPGTNVVEVLVARVRRKIDPDGTGVIETVPGEGYRFADPERPVR